MISMRRCARSVGSAEPEFSLTIDRTRDGLLRIGAFVDQVAAALRLGNRAEYALRLCLEEAVANLVIHGQPDADSAPDTVAVRLNIEAARLRATIEDRCIPFDPRDAPAPTRPANLADTKIGGLGIHLMRQYASTVDYDCVGAANQLTLTIERS